MYAMAQVKWSQQHLGPPTPNHVAARTADHGENGDEMVMTWWWIVDFPIEMVIFPLKIVDFPIDMMKIWEGSLW